MPEPDRNIEKQLEAYAEKRRREAGAPFEMHPATRRMLLGEVSRRKAKASRGESRLTRLFTAHRSRLAFAAYVMAVLAVAAVLLLPPSRNKKAEFARLD